MKTAHKMALTQCLPHSWLNTDSGICAKYHTQDSINNEKNPSETITKLSEQVIEIK